MKGKIVLVPFPFTSLRKTKLRPALVLHEGPRDATLAFISSRIDHYDPQTDVLITEDHPEFQGTGLKVPSLIRLTKIATVQKDLIIGELGEIGPSVQREVTQKVMFSTGV